MKYYEIAAIVLGFIGACLLGAVYLTELISTLKAIF
jgi:hypothetical protein